MVALLQHFGILTISNGRTFNPHLKVAPKQFATANLHRPKEFDEISSNQIATLASLSFAHV